MPSFTIGDDVAPEPKASKFSIGDDSPTAQPASVPLNPKPPLPTTTAKKQGTIKKTDSTIADDIGDWFTRRYTAPMSKRDFVDRVANAATFGLSDVVNSAAPGVPDPDTGKIDKRSYAERIKAKRKADNEYAKENPFLAGAGDVLGMVGAAPAAIGAKVATSLPRVIGQGVAQGGIGGAISGAAEADPNLPAAGKGALTGGLLGATLGGTIPIVGAGLPAAVRSIGNVVGLGNPEKTAERVVNKAVARGNTTPEEMRAAFGDARDVGAPATLSGTGPESVASLADTVINQPGASRDVAKKLKDEHFGMEQNSRITQAGEKHLTPDSDFLGTIEALNKEASQQSRPAYEKAYYLPDGTPRTVDSPKIRKLMLDHEDEVKSALSGAIEIVKADATANGGNWSGRAIIDGKPTVEILDGISRYYGGKIGEAQRAGNSTEVRRLTQIKDTLLKETDSAVPEFAAARKTWGDPMSRAEAVEIGRDLMAQGNITPDAAAREFAKLGDAEKKAARIGVMEYISNQIGKPRAEEGNAVKSFFQGTDAKKKLAVFFPDEASFNTYAKTLGIESDLYDRISRMTGGSATAHRTAAREDLERETGAGHLPEIITHPIRSTANLIAHGINRLDNMGTATRDKIGQMLLETDPAKVDQTIELLVKRYNLDQESRLKMQNIARMAATAAGEGAGNFAGSVERKR
jgi:hypothetical protein